MSTDFYKGERMYWDMAASQEQQEHLARYAFAREIFLPDWTCLDAACGSGYGSEFLAQKVRKVIGFDANEHALDYAKERHGPPNTSFHQVDLNGILPLADNVVDAIASFETLEHVENQRGMIIEFLRVLKPGGVMAISTPDRDVLSQAGGRNQYHVAELSKKEFLRMLQEHCVVEELYGHVKYRPVSAGWRGLHTFLKFVSKADVFNVREKVLGASGYYSKVRALRRRFWPMMTTPLEFVSDWDNPTHAYLVAIVRKQIH
jgi:2-polyprenyl-3-methyl-5-hydroxy-6-metoxy-1,4-benzoquinol methylase